VDVRQSRLIEDLAGIFRGEILCDPVSRALYASDGSLHQVTPLGIARPRDREDVLTLVRYAAENHLPLIPRGAGTSVGGEALGSGIIVDFSRHMRAIEEIGAQTVRVQPGVVLSQLNHVLREAGRYFPPDPSNADTTTIGSMLALDSAGSHSIRVGSTRDHVISIDLVTARGFHFEASSERVHDRPAEVRHAVPDGDNEGFKQTLVSKLASLLRVNADVILKEQPERQLRNRAGYMLRGALSESLLSVSPRNGQNGDVTSSALGIKEWSLSLPRLLVGSEGTLGLFTGATLRTSALPAYRCALLIVFGSVDSAIKAVQTIAGHQPSACDLVDRRLLTLARDLDPRFATLIPATAEAALIVEQTGFSQSEIAQRARDLMQELKELPDAGRSLFEATTVEEIDFLWSLPNRVIPLLNRARGETSPIPIVEDIAVPPESMLDFVSIARRVFQKHEITASLYAHAAVGQVHMRPFLRAPFSPILLEDLATDLYEAAISVGGSISGEHGLGLSRTAFLPMQYRELCRVFQQIKMLFDPDHLLNPGKVLSLDPHLTVHHLRPEEKIPSPLVELQLKWQPGELQATAMACHGCGACRTQQPSSRMCPFFRTDPAEERSPRAKANAVRAILDGRLPQHELASTEMQQLSKVCFNCKQCQLECPTGINVPQLMLETKAQFVTANGPRMSDWFLSRVHGWSNTYCRYSWLINPLLNRKSIRWFAEKLLGVSRHRKLPPFARRTFLKSAPPGWLAPPASLRDPVPVIYFVDHFANSHDPELAFAFVRVLEHHGKKVHVPPTQSRSGMALISTGDLDAARQLAAQNVRVLAEFAREGCPIVCTEPAAALCLKVEYPRILDHPDVQLVADHVVEAGQFLSQMHARSELRTDFSPLPMSAVYHTPCHLRSLGSPTGLFDLCQLIPELKATSVEHGCSGLAGTYGLTREHFDESLRIGHKLMEQMRSNQIEFGVTECSSCKLQMEQQSTTPTLHPLKVLALAYGLMPEIQRRLKPNLRKLLTS
jgi:FAD/FMN-containing dehydrogenase/Fe-S oxidoreductase